MRSPSRVLLLAAVAAATSALAPTGPALAQLSSCATRAQTGAVIARRAITAPADGFVTARLAGPATTDWDLGIVDRATGHVLNGSAGPGSTEIATAAVRAGQALVLQSCRLRGPARAVARTVRFTRAPARASPRMKLVRVPFRTDFDREA